MPEPATDATPRRKQDTQKEHTMKPKALLSVAVAICVGAAGAQAENTKESKAALGQLKGIEKTSGDAAKDANQGKLAPRDHQTPVAQAAVAPH